MTQIMTMQPKTVTAFAHDVIRWQQRHGRHDLPWQQQKSRYSVWISEVMLQQTGVHTVLHYYPKFIQRFPTPSMLAASSLDEVLALWSGLGYYRRARFLWASAKIIVDQYHGELPDRVEELLMLPGIGQSTAHAILSLHDNQALPILDGNVKRVLARVFQVDEPYGSHRFMQDLWSKAYALMPPQDSSPQDRPTHSLSQPNLAQQHPLPHQTSTPTSFQRSAASYNQGMMDLGATVCRKSQPLCAQCPVSEHCQGYQHNNAEYYPVKARKKKPKPTTSLYFLLLRYRHWVLMHPNPAAGIWPNLWVLPHHESQQTLRQSLAHLSPQTMRSSESFKHSFTHYHLIIHPLIAHLDDSKSRPQAPPQHQWVDVNKLDELGIPAPLRTMLLSHRVSQ